MNEIYKINYIKNNKTEKIIVFIGEKIKYTSIDLKELLYNEPSNKIIKEILTEEEIDDINTYNIDVEFILNYIHKDDTIECIKYKIIEAFDYLFSFEEIYLFCKKNEYLDSTNIFQKLTRNGKLDLSKEKLISFLLNYQDINFNILPEKDFYTYDDILLLNLDKTFIVNTFIGQHLITMEKFYTANPYNVLSIDNELEDKIDSILTTTNKNLLLNYGNINNNTIYLCLGNDIIENSINKNHSTVLMIKQYFYFLDKLKIYDLEKLQQKKETLIQNSKDKIKSEYSLYNKKINLFHNIFHEKKNDLSYLTSGIDLIEFVLNAKIIFNMPLEMLFKFLNSTKKIPLIKYNPGLKKENIYRLFSPYKDTNKSKIPYVTKSNLLKIDRYLAKRKRVGFFIVDKTNLENNEIIMEIDNKGNIFITVKFEKYVTIEKIEKIIKKNINPILKIIKDEFDTNGHIIDLFSSFDNKNVEILTLNYNSIMEINSNINLTKFLPCLGCIFDVYEKNLKKGIKMSFKRVSNYNKMDGQEAFIFDLLMKRYTDDEIIDEIKTNYSISLEESKLLFAKVISNLQILRNLDESRKIKIKSSPGFKILIDPIKFKNQIKISILNINNINYLETLPLYIDTLIRLNQNIETTNISSNEINTICKIKVDEIKSGIEDKISLIEKPYPETIALTEIDLGDQDEDEQLLNMILGDDSDDDSDFEKKIEDLSDIASSETIKTTGGSDTSGASSLSSINMGSLNLEEDSKNSDEVSEKKIKEAFVESEPEKSDSETEDEEEEEIMDESINLFSKKPPPEPIDIEKKKEKSESTIIEEELYSIANITPRVEQEKTILEPLIDGDPDQIYNLFCYGSNNINQLKYRTKNPKLKANKALLLDHIRIFAGESKKWNNSAVASLKENPGLHCRGTYVVINDHELNVLKKYEGEQYYTKQIIFKDEKEIEKKGIVFIKKDNTWLVHPTIDYIMACVENIVLFWKDLDENNELLIKDEYSTIKGVYNNIDKKYIKMDDKDIEPEKDEEISLDVTGENLGYPNPFSKRLEDREPTLFYKKDKKDSVFESYSRMCPWNVKRQPVILTQKEKEKIDKNHPGSYNEVLTYGSDPNEQYHYICPRYWSLKHNTSLTEEEVKSGKYGNLIPENSKKVPKNTNIFEFTDNKVHKNREGEYVQHYPGFLKKPGRNNVCIPCCFSSKNKAFKQRKEECKQDPSSKTVKSIEDLKRPSTMLRRASSEINDIILAPDKYPIDTGRWGYLPFSIQHFLDTDNLLCQKTKKNPALKENTPCILRKGIEINKKQSFIGCLSDLYIYQTSPMVEFIPTISEMRKIITDSLNLDIFVTLNNGNLVNIFSENRNVDISKYTNTNFYKKIIKSDPSQLVKSIEAFENFLNFLLDEDSIIDHTYLWDLLTNENNIFKNKLIKRGINLIILEVINEDFTENVNILCPSNHFSNTFFDDNKLTFLLIKIDEYYEPIYIVTDKKKYVKEEKLINFKSESIMPELKKSLLFIKKKLEHCKPFQELPKEYKFKFNIPAYEINNIITSHNYTVQKQIINYNNKVIGLDVEKDGEYGYIPCYPSSINNAIEYIHIEEYNWKTYRDTVDFLIKLYKNCNGKISCLPIIKIIEDELVVAIITQTNQLIPLAEPEENILDDGLKEIKQNNFLTADKTSILSKNVDNDRVEFVRNIKLEKQFYDTFKMAIKNFVTQYKNISYARLIESIIENDILTYKTKLVKIKMVIKDLIKDKIEFTRYNLETLTQLTEITNCFLDSDCDKKQFCVKSDDEMCKFIIPDKNLINGKDNEKLYLSRISDEFIRFNRIKTLFNPNNITIFKEQKYNLNENEFLLLHSLISNYYDKLLLKENNNKKKPFDNINTKPNNVYDTEDDKTSKDDELKNEAENESENESENLELNVDCIKEEKLISGSWQKIFPPGSKEVSYKEVPICSFKILIDILKEFDPLTYRDVTIKQIKDLLVEAYQNNNEIINKMLKLLIHEGKSRTLINSILKKNTTMQNFIASEDFYITNLDIIVLSGYLNIPLVLYSSSINESNKLITMNLVDEYSFCIRMSYRIRDHKMANFKLLKKNTFKISFSKIKPENITLFRSKQLTVEEYVTQQIDLILKSVKKITTK